MARSRKFSGKSSRKAGSRVARNQVRRAGIGHRTAPKHVSRGIQRAARKRTRTLAVLGQRSLEAYLLAQKEGILPLNETKPMPSVPTVEEHVASQRRLRRLWFAHRVFRNEATQLFVGLGIFGIIIGAAATQGLAPVVALLLFFFPTITILFWLIGAGICEAIADRLPYPPDKIHIHIASGQPILWRYGRNGWPNKNMYRTPTPADLPAVEKFTRACHLWQR